MIDLHIHTTASADGQFDPTRIVRMASEIGIEALAVADHNVVNGVAPAREACHEAGIEFVSGIELNTDYKGRDLHLLGYGFDPEDSALPDWLDSIKKRRVKKCRQWADNLASLGLTIEYDEVALLTPGREPTGSSYLRSLMEHPENLTHPLVAPYLPGAEKGDNPYVHFYFEVLVEGPARSDITVLTIEQAIEDLGKFGALPVLAHPVDIDESTVKEFRDKGLGGIEAASSYHDSDTTNKYFDMAQKFGIVPTAGSDFHGPKFKKHVKLGDIYPNGMEIFNELKQAIGKMKSS